MHRTLGAHKKQLNFERSWIKCKKSILGQYYFPKTQNTSNCDGQPLLKIMSNAMISESLYFCFRSSGRVIVFNSSTRPRFLFLKICNISAIFRLVFTPFSREFSKDYIRNKYFWGKKEFPAAQVIFFLSEIKFFFVRQQGAFLKQRPGIFSLHPPNM